MPELYEGVDLPSTETLARLLGAMTTIAIVALAVSVIVVSQGFLYARWLAYH